MRKPKGDQFQTETDSLAAAKAAKASKVNAE